MELSPWLSIPRITVGLHARVEQPLPEEETIVAPAFSRFGGTARRQQQLSWGGIAS